MTKINIDQFKSINIQIGTITSAEIVEDADKLLKLSVNLGEEEERTIVSGIREHVSPEDLVGKQVPFVTNLEPREIRGIESNGMILAVGGDTFALLHPHIDVSPGARVG